jgi:endonuclease YncB( thermonuclease family)
MSRYRQPFKLSPAQRRFRYAGRKTLLLAILSAVLGSLVWADRSGLFGTAQVADLQKYDGKTFTVVRVIDGDTIDINVADGKFPNTRLRLWGVDTPETTDPRRPGFVGFFGPEAKHFTRQQTLGKQVKIQLEPSKSPRDKYGRLLAWVYLPDGRLFNRLLIEEGYAYADPRFAHHLNREFRRLQNQAIKARRGLWVNGPPADMPRYMQKNPSN